MTMIQSEVGKEENLRCAECYAPTPAFVSINLGVFICGKCAQFHKKLSIDRNNVAAVNSHQFTEEQVAFIRTRGNRVVNEGFEKYLPKCYHRPDADDPPLIRGQFIKAKYDREEFKDISKQDGYALGSKTGSLFKRGKDNDKFLHRKFILHEPEGKLEYFIKFRDRVPKDTVVVRNLVNVYLAPEKIGNPNGMQITYEKDGIRRNLYVFGNDGKTTIDWYHAIRASMIKHKYQSFTDDQMKRYLNTKIIREGWMSKTGPKRQERFRKRWFSLVGTMIWYYEHPLDAHPINYIPLGSKTFGYGVKKGLPKGVRADGYGVTVHTPERVYALACSSMESRDKWVTAVQKVLESCTSFWAPPTKDEKESDEVQEEAEEGNPSSFSTSSTKYRPSSDESSEENLESETVDEKSAAKETTDTSTSSKETINTPTPSKETTNTATSSKETINTPTPSKETTNTPTPTSKSPMFEKKAKPNKPPAKYNKKSSGKRVSSTKKVTSTEFQRSGSDGESNEASLSSSDDEDMPRHSDESEGSDEVEIVYATKQAEEECKDNNVSLSPVEKVPVASPRKPPRQQLQNGDQLSSSPPDKLQPDGKNLEVIINHADVGSHQINQPSSTKSDDDAVVVRMEKRNDGDEKSLFKSSLRRIEGHKRASMRCEKNSSKLTSSGFGTEGSEEEMKNTHVDITLANQSDESFWFLVFQSESEIDDKESYVTPWVGAKVAEAPASVGPIRVPIEFELGIIDTAPGGFGLMRTTGPFYSQPGDVWEVEISDEEESNPEIFFHEGIETEDGSVMVYSSQKNKKKFEAAIFKSGRKLTSRKNVGQGESIHIHIPPDLYFLQLVERNGKTASMRWWGGVRLCLAKNIAGRRLTGPCLAFCLVYKANCTHAALRQVSYAV